MPRQQIVIREINSVPKNGKNNKKKNKSKAKANGPARKQPSNRKDIMLSRCALKYALAIAKPFHPSAKGSCLPVFPSPPSQKVTAYTRFQGFVGTAGYGFISCQPALANDGVVAFVSNAAYTGTTMAPLSANNTLTVGVSVVGIGSLPYRSLQLQGTTGGNSVYGRIISFGIRISYVGTTFNESGSYYVLTTPGHENLLAVANTLPLMGSFADCNVCSVTREVCEGAAFPISSLETQYASSTNANSSTLPLLYPYSSAENQQNGGFTYLDTSGNSTGSPIQGIQFQGVAGSAFLIEIIEHCEFIGSATSAVVTPTDSDQRGFEIVTAASERIPQLKLAQPHRDPLDLMKDAIYEVAAGIKPYAVSALTAAGIALLM